MEPVCAHRVYDLLECIVDHRFCYEKLKQSSRLSPLPPVCPLVSSVTWTAAPEADHTSKTPEMQLTERLQRCQKEHHDLSLMLQTVTQGTSTFSTVKLTSDIPQT